MRELHGRLPLEEQRRALKPEPDGRRRVVLSTAIAESSVTVDGVRIVIDAGQERVPVFQPRSGLSRLETRRVNRASADQRRGRAGRQGPGLCLRLWAEEQPLPAHGEPEMLQADLAPLAFELARWGIVDPAGLAWITPPPVGALAAGRRLLQRLGLMDEGFLLTELGRSCVRWPTHPRLAAMLARAGELDAAPLACALVATLEGRDLDGEQDLERTLQARLAQPTAHRQWQREAQRLARIGGVGLEVSSLAPLGSCWRWPIRTASRSVSSTMPGRVASAWPPADWRPCPSAIHWPMPSCWWPPSWTARPAVRASSAAWPSSERGSRRCFPKHKSGGRAWSGRRSRGA
ncbi:helicase-related protein [Halomonas sp. E19]|uniref:helicase-related protein n=1 Tax=Halomonas sp. E19 TaxID=3397247 RepID=UPI004033AB16